LPCSITIGDDVEINANAVLLCAMSSNDQTPTALAVIKHFQ